MNRLYFLISAAAFAALSASAQTDAPVLEPATFEDLNLPAESWWVGDTEDEDYALGTFRSGSFEFNNFYMADYQTWGFFGYANETGNVYPGGYEIADQMLNCVGGGHESAAYGMGFIAPYMGPSVITIPDFEETGVNVGGVWVTNSAWVVKAILEGDGMSPAFSKGDYIKLTFKGSDKDGKETSADFMLADYTSENEADHYYVDSWRYFDLSGLGDVVKIQTDFFSTKANDYGITTPCYFAFDDLGVKSGQTDVAGAAAELPEVRVSVAGGVATVAAATADFTVEAIGIDGSRREVRAVNGAARVELPACGVNILRVSSEAGVSTLKVINR